MIAYRVLQQVTVILRTLTILFQGTSFNLINKSLEKYNAQISLNFKYLRFPHRYQNFSIIILLLFYNI